jgi:MFS family permease
LIDSKKKISKNAAFYLAALMFFCISSGAFSMLQGIYIKELDLGEDFLGIIISLRTLAIAVFSIPCAIFVNKFGKKKALLIAFILTPLLIIFQGYFRSKWLLLALAILQGGTNSFMSVSEGPFFMENSNEKNRLRLFSFSFADNVFSTMIGYSLFGYVSGVLHSRYTIINALRYSIIISGLIGLIAVIFILRLKENNETKAKLQQAFYKDMLKVVKNKNSFNFLIYNFIIGFGAGLVVPYFNVYLKYKVNIGTEQIGLIMALAQGAMGLGGLITPFIAQKIGKVNTIIACQVASIPFLMLIAMPPSIIVVSIALFMRNGLMNMAGPIVGNMSMELVENTERSIFASVNNISGNLSRGLSAVVAGFIMTNFKNGYEIPYFITAILYIMGTVHFYKSFSKFGLKSKTT